MRMKKTVGLLLAVLVVFITPVFAGLGSQSFANINFDDDVVTDEEIETAETSFSQPGMLPDHPLYFLKRFSENIMLLFTFSQEAKAKLHLQMAETRLAEAVAMAENNKIKEAEGAIGDFSSELNNFDDARKGIGSAASSIAKETENVLEKSALVLRVVSEKVPEQAKPAIEKAIENSIEKKVNAGTYEGRSSDAWKQKMESEKKRSEEIRHQVKESIEKRGEPRNAAEEEDEDDRGTPGATATIEPTPTPGVTPLPTETPGDDDNSRTSGSNSGSGSSGREHSGNDDEDDDDED